MSYDKIGDVQVAQGDLPEALKSLPRRARDCRPSGEGRPRQRRLAARPVGVVRQDRRRAGGAGRSAGGAEIATATALAISERLAKADPGNAGWQRDLSVSYNKIGDVQVAQGDLPAALKATATGSRSRERLAKADPGNAGWQRDLSVSYDKIGDVQVAQGDLAAALKATATGSRSASVWRRPTPATPAGSATSRCRTTRSATCRWRRAIWRRR